MSREDMFKQMVAEFPDSAMAHFSLGSHYLQAKQYREAVASLETACRLQADYAAAWVALGDALAGAGESAKAKDAYGRARACALAQGHGNLAAEIEQKARSLGG